MHAELRKRLRSAFDRAMAARRPPFERLPGGDRRTYRQPIGEAANIFVELNVAPRYEAYSIGIAWSRGDVYPWDASVELDLVDAHGSSGRVAVMNAEGNRDMWWNLVTGGTNPREGQPSLADGLAGKTAWEKGQPEHIEACVAATMAKLDETLPAFIVHAGHEMASSAAGG